MCFSEMASIFNWPRISCVFLPLRRQDSNDKLWFSLSPNLSCDMLNSPMPQFPHLKSVCVEESYQPHEVVMEVK